MVIWGGDSCGSSVNEPEGATEMIGIVSGSVAKHRHQDSEQAIGDAAEGPSVGMTSLPQGGVLSARSRVGHRSNPRPMIPGGSEPAVTGVPHPGNPALATLVSDRGDARMGAQRRVVAGTDGPRRLGQHGGRHTRPTPGHERRMATSLGGRPPSPGSSGSSVSSARRRSRAVAQVFRCV